MSVRRASPLLWLPLVVLCTYGGIWWQTEGTRWQPEAAQWSAHHAGVFVQAAWHRRLPHARNIALDADGALAGIVAQDGTVHLFGNGTSTEVDASEKGAASSTPTTDGANADTLVLSSRGKLAVAYRRGDATNTLLRFLRPDGSRFWERRLGAAIVDFSLASDGRRAACITDKGEIYAFDLTGRHPRSRHWRFNGGKPRQVLVLPGNGLIAVATVDPPDGWIYHPDGSFAWKMPNSGEEIGAANLASDPEGRFLACATTPNSLQPQSRFVVMSAGGRQQWGAHLRAADPRVALSTNGRYAAVTYTKIMTDAAHTVLERKISLFATGKPDGTPVQAWQHGGPFYDPRLVAIAADGAFVATRDGGRNIHFFGREGQLLWRYKAPAPIVSTRASADGHYILIYCNDATLALLHVLGSPEDRS